METIKIITLVAGIIFAIDLTTLTIMYISNQRLMEDIRRHLTIKEELKIIMEEIDYDRKDKK